MFAIIRSLFVVAVVAAAVGGGTYSYFSKSAESTGNDITTGTLSVSLLNQNTSDPFAFHVTGLLPGGTKLVNFDVKNDSATPVQIRGAAFGEWASVVSPDNTLMKVVKIERYDGGWQQIYSGVGFTGYFYDSPDGNDTSNYTVPAGGKAQFQLTVELDPSAGDKYQGEVYNAAVKVQARQDGASSWPTDLNVGF